MQNHGFEIAITHSLLISDQALFELSAQAGKFVSWIEQSEDAWFTWERMNTGILHRFSPRDAEAFGATLDPDREIALAVCRQIQHHQAASDLGLSSFWNGHGFNLTNRSHTLLANDHGQFQIFFRFTFEPDERTRALDRPGQDRAAAEAISRLCKRSPIAYPAEDIRFAGVYDTFAHGHYAWSVLSSAKRVLDRAIDSLFLACGTIDTSTPIHHHLRTGHIEIQHDTGFPWVLAGTLDPAVMSMFEHEEDLVDKSYTTPNPNEPFVYIGWNYGLVSEHPGPGKYSTLIAPTLIYLQFSYHSVRQLQRKILREMERTFNHSSTEALREASDRFDFITLSFERFSLDFSRFSDSLFARIRVFADSIIGRWNLNTSIEHISSSLNQQRNIIGSQHRLRLHQVNCRQEVILFTIALLQIFAIISVITDYATLNSLAPPPEAAAKSPWLVEQWVVHAGVLVPLTLLATVLLVAVWYYHGAIRNLARGLMATYQRKKIVRQLSAAEKIRCEDSAPKCRPARSETHGKGLVCTHPIAPGETILKIQAGVPVDAHTHFNESGNREEWNAVPGGRLYIRKAQTEYVFINHSRTPNAHVEFDQASETFTVLCEATSGLQPDEEVFLDYRKEPLTDEYLVKYGGYL